MGYSTMAHLRDATQRTNTRITSRVVAKKIASTRLSLIGVGQSGEVGGVGVVPPVLDAVGVAIIMCGGSVPNRRQSAISALCR